ncbi:MAG: hypothetical protein OQK82_09115 [Candidatus Pacearchaeota archaeon]|nr:hypothetical protein [Candidatus Pacearchaeota archaeon]
MLNKNMSKSDIEKCLASKGGFIRIDYLTKFLKEDLSIEMKKFAYLKLAETYEGMKLFSDAASVYESLAILSLTFAEKRGYYLKGCELCILAGNFVQADEFLQKSMSQANANKKREIYDKVKDFYKRIAKHYEEEDKRNKASIIYEKLLEMRIHDFERKEIKDKLKDLYERLGKKVNF